MNMLSENIKTARMTRCLTYAQLADAIGVEVQVVKDWENGLYVPDAAMCEKISAFFGVSIESPDIEKIKKDKVLEESVKANKRMFTVFAVLGSLFVGIGITILLVALWDRFPGVIKTGVSFLPLLLSQCGVLFTYKKKYENTTWREGASILWSLGVTATVGLVSMVLGLHFGVGICLLIDAVLILPILFFFDVISPLAFFHIYAFCGTSILLDTSGFSEALSVLVLMFYVGAGVLFYFLSKKTLEGKRASFVKIITLVASCGFLMFLSSALGWGHLSILGAVAVLLCMCSKEEVKSLYVAGYISTAFFSVLSVKYMLSEELYYPFELGLKTALKAEYLVVVFATLAILGFAFLKKGNITKNNLHQTVFAGLGAAISVVALLNPLFDAYMVIGLVLFAFVFVQGLVAVVNGINKNKYIVLNIGLIEVLTLMIFVLSAYDWNMVTVGIMFLISGASFFGANFYISRKIQKEQLVLKGEVCNDEEQ